MAFSCLFFVVLVGSWFVVCIFFFFFFFSFGGRTEHLVEGIDARAIRNQRRQRWGPRIQAFDALGCSSGKAEWIRSRLGAHLREELYCLQSDREAARTNRQLGWVTAKGSAAHPPILQKQSGYSAERDIEEVMRYRRRRTGPRVLQDLYREIEATAVTPDLTCCGPARACRGTRNPSLRPIVRRFAAIRIAITARPPPERR